MQYDWEFARRIRCTSSEKAKCLPLVLELVKLAKKARSYGLLSLLDEAESETHVLLRKGLQLIVDGEKPSIVNEILTIAILAGDRRGRELLEECLIQEGLSGIQEGHNPKTIKETLLAFLGEENARIYEVQYEASPLADMEAFLHEMEMAKSSTPESSELDQTLKDLDDEAIQLCLREITTVDLARALQGLSAAIHRRVFEVLPKRGASTLKDVMEQSGEAAPMEIAEAHAKIRSILSDLNDRGAIRLPG
jgi:hypothetical protein